MGMSGKERPEERQVASERRLVMSVEDDPIEKMSEGEKIRRAIELNASEYRRIC